MNDKPNRPLPCARGGFEDFSVLPRSRAQSDSLPKTKYAVMNEGSLEQELTIELTSPYGSFANASAA